MEQNNNNNNPPPPPQHHAGFQFGFPQPGWPNGHGFNMWESYYAPFFASSSSAFHTPPQPLSSQPQLLQQNGGDIFRDVQASSSGDEHLAEQPSKQLENDIFQQLQAHEQTTPSNTNTTTTQELSKTNQTSGIERPIPVRAFPPQTKYPEHPGQVPMFPPMAPWNMGFYHPQLFFSPMGPIASPQDLQNNNNTQHANMFVPSTSKQPPMPGMFNNSPPKGTVPNHPAHYLDHSSTIVLPDTAIDTVSMESSSSNSESENINGSTLEERDLELFQRLSRKRFNRLKRKCEVLTVSKKTNAAAETMGILTSMNIDHFEKHMDDNDTKTQIFYKAIIQRILYGNHDKIPEEIRSVLTQDDLKTIEKIKNCDRETLKKLFKEFQSNCSSLSVGPSASSSSGLEPSMPKRSKIIGGLDLDKFLHCDEENETKLRERLLMNFLQESKPNCDILAASSSSSSSVAVNNVVNSATQESQKEPSSAQESAKSSYTLQLLLKESQLIEKIVEAQMCPGGRQNATMKHQVKPSEIVEARKKIQRTNEKMNILKAKVKISQNQISENIKTVSALKAKVESCMAHIRDVQKRKNIYDNEIQMLQPVIVRHENNFKNLKDLLDKQASMNASNGGEWNSSKFLCLTTLHTGIGDIDFFRFCSFAFMKPHTTIKKFSEINFCERYEKMFKQTLDIAEGRKFKSSQLEHFKFYRFSAENKSSVMSDCFSNSINPQQILCKWDTNGHCNDRNCLFQHRKDYLLSDTEKIVDLLAYFRSMRSEINLNQLIKTPRVEMEGFVEKLKKKYPNIVNDLKNIEGFAQKLVEKFKNNLVETFVIRPFPTEVFKHTDMKRDCAFLKEYDYRFYCLDEAFLLKPKEFIERNYDGITFSRRFYSSDTQEREEIQEIFKLKDPVRTFRVLKLAYSYLNQRDSSSIVVAIDKAMVVLKTAFENELRSAQICSHYIRFYSAKLRLQQQFRLGDMLSPLSLFCKKMLDFSPFYEVWILYLKSVNIYSQKEQITESILKAFRLKQIVNDDVEQHSANLTEIVLYKIHLAASKQNHEDGINFFRKYFSSPEDKSLNELLTSSDRVFLWLCFIHYAIFKVLPHEHFDHKKQSSFRSLLSRTGFVFDFQFIFETMSISNAEIITLFYSAMSACCKKFDASTGRCLEDGCHCEALRCNVVQLLSIEQKELIYFKNLLSLETDLSYIYLDKIFSITMTNSIDLNLLEENFTSCLPKETSIELLYMKNYLYAFYSNKFGLKSVAKSFLVKNLFLLFDGCESFNGNLKQYDETQDVIYQKVFKTVVLDQALNDDVNINFVHLVDKIDKQRLELSKNSVHFQLSYMFYISILITEDNKYEQDIKERYEVLDRCFTVFFSSAEIAQVKIEKIYFWIGYVSILLQLQDNGSEAHFCYVFDKLSTICKQFNLTHPNLVFHLVCHFGKFIKRNDRTDYYIEMCYTSGYNPSLIMKTLHLVYETQKEKCYTFVSELILQKGIRLNVFSFWSIAICLAVERSDHMFAHKFFQLALMTMPFEKELLKMMKSYETAVGHDGHLRCLRDHCEKNQLADVFANP